MLTNNNSTFYDDNKYYPNMFLDGYFYKIGLYP